VACFILWYYLLLIAIALGAVGAVLGAVCAYLYLRDRDNASSKYMAEVWRETRRPYYWWDE
jgi:hypothetical protein